jgi:hypothetical protein
MILIILLVAAVVVGGGISLVAGMSGVRILGPISAMVAAVLVFYGLVSLL